MLRKMKEDLEKMNRRERRYAVEDEDNDSQDDEDETPEGEEVPNASHDLIIDE